jgi:hypothetical protein
MHWLRLRVALGIGVAGEVLRKIDEILCIACKLVYYFGWMEKII